jgi:hypothetical protein
VNDDGRKQERKTPAKGSAEFQMVNNFLGQAMPAILVHCGASHFNTTDGI